MKSYACFDPTDSFSQETRVYVNKNQVVKIEPQFSDKISYSWLTDKGRLFFDGISGAQNSQHSVLLIDFFKSIKETFYIFSLCNFKSAEKLFFIIIFENVSLEVISFLGLVSKLHSFIKIKRVEKTLPTLNLESDFQISSATSSPKLQSSSLCLLVGINTRYEGSYLNLRLRQRYLKGNFRALILGSSLNLTFPVSFLGSNSVIFKSIAEGNHVSCKDIVNAVNPIFVTNTEILKDKSIQASLNVLKYSSVLNEVWNGLNVLNSSLYESSSNAFGRFSFLTFKDLTSFSSIYALNVDLNKLSGLHAKLGSRILRHKNSKALLNGRLFINQNVFKTDVLKPNFFKKYLYIPSNTFFENQETFINTEGFRKVSSKLIFKKSTKSDWQILRKLAKNLLTKNNLGCTQDAKILFYHSKLLFDFKNFMGFHFQATPSLTSFTEHLAVSNQKFFLCKNFSIFKCLSTKMQIKKLKYWLDDFYTGGKENLCQNSLMLNRCSVNYKLQGTTFF